MAGDERPPTAHLPQHGRVEGVVTLVQEGRFRLQHRDGRGYLFALRPGAGADAERLREWASAGTTIIVDYEGPPDLGAVATRVAVHGGDSRTARMPVTRVLRALAGLPFAVARAIAQTRDEYRPATPAAPCAAATAAAESDGDEPVVPRRRFLTRLTVACGAAVATLLGVPAASILVWPPGRQTGATWRRIGEASAFPVGRTQKVTYLDIAPLPWAGFAAESAAWLRREPDGRFVAFTIYCTHTGCPVRWEEQAQLFMCPCHGGAFHRDGEVAAGPPPTPLTRYSVRVVDGVVEIQPTPLPRQTSG